MPRTAFARSLLSGAVKSAGSTSTAATAEQAVTTLQRRLLSSALTAESASSAGLLRGAGARLGAPSAHALLTPCACGKVLCPGHARPLSTSAAAAAAQPAVEPAWAADERAPGLAERLAEVTRHFPSALAVDDFMARVEVALAGYGFNGDNAIAMSNLCRDESCLVLEDKIEAAFGSCFSTHGLGGVLTCGVIGIKAGLSHSPVVGGKERYVFFSFPHIAIDSAGKVGAVSRPNRPGASAACGALIAVTGDLKRDGIAASCSTPGLHDPLEPEYSILKQRIARRLAYEGVDAASLDLVAVTKAAERVISADLEYLISKAVDPAKADYAVFTGVQIHNWAADLNNTAEPSLEFVGLGASYVVVDGAKTHLDLERVPALSPRQLQILSSAPSSDSSPRAATASSGGRLVVEIPRDYLMRRLGGAQSRSHMEAAGGPVWSSYVATQVADGPAGAPTMDK